MLTHTHVKLYPYKIMETIYSVILRTMYAGLREKSSFRIKLKAHVLEKWITFCLFDEM